MQLLGILVHVLRGPNSVQLREYSTGEALSDVFPLSSQGSLRPLILYFPITLMAWWRIHRAVRSCFERLDLR